MRYSIIIGLVIALLLFWLAPTKSIVNIKNAMSSGKSDDNTLEVIQMQSEEIPVPQKPDKNINIDQDADKVIETIKDTSEPKLGDPPVNPDLPPDDFVFFEEAPIVINKIVPEFPEMAKQNNISGKVHVRVWVDVNGNVKKALIMKSDNPMFDKPALDAAQKTKFTPAKVDNKPVAVWFALIYKFEMH